MSVSATIWDLPTRVVHWCVAAAIIANLFAFDGSSAIHHWIGYVALIFICFRIVWGFVGGKYSRFSQFPIRTHQVIQFFRNPLSKNLPDYPGHNPAASIAYLNLWICVINLAITGWMLSWDIYFGEEWLEKLHNGFAILVQIIIVVHLLGLTVDSIKLKRKTWLGMITGRRF